MIDFLRRIIQERKADHLTGQENNWGSTDKFEPTLARVAIYDAPLASPRVIDLSSDDRSELIDRLTTKIYQFAHEKGGTIPFTVIREIVENLLHANFHEVVVTILDNGNTIRVSDQGPGIPDKEKACQPGFSTADFQIKRLIKGVGSGLPVAKESLSFLGGQLEIDDNMNKGTVVTIKLGGGPAEHTAEQETNSASYSLCLTNRQKKILSLITELGAAGPSLIASELEIGLSTAYRDLMYLEEKGLLKADESGKRTLTSEGVKYLDVVFNS